MDSEVNGTGQGYTRGQHPRSVTTRFKPGNKAAAGVRRERLKAEHETWVGKGCPETDVGLMCRWVLASLDVKEPSGCPGPEARSLLRWARENQTRFMRMFVVKVMMEDFKAARKEKPKADRQEPEDGRSLEEMMKLLKGEGP